MKTLIDAAKAALPWLPPDTAKRLSDAIEEAEHETGCAPPDLSDLGPYATADDEQTAIDCGISVLQLRMDRAKEDQP